jgi:cytochrome c oxidase subunit 4
MSAEISPRAYWVVFLALMLLLALTVAVSFLHLGPLGVAMSLTIAAAKAALVILYFMHARVASRLTRVFVVTGFLWLGILFELTLTDYLTRSWLPVSESWSPSVTVHRP